MKEPNTYKTGSLLLGIFIMLGLLILGLSPSSAASLSQDIQTISGPEVSTYAADRYTAVRVYPSEELEVGIQRANFVVNYNPEFCGFNLPPWPQEAKVAFEYATDIWASLLTSTPTIEVDACWNSPGTVFLGSTIAQQNFSFLDAPVPNTFYPVALANALAGRDLNGDTPEIRAIFDSAANWNFDPNIAPNPNQYDFATLVLHVLGHGLGFTSSMRVETPNSLGKCDGVGTGCWGRVKQPDPPLPNIYDRFTQNDSGQSLLDETLFPNPSFELADQLTGGGDGVFFDGPKAREANGDSPVKLYTPDPWDPSFSYVNLDESTYPRGNLNSLMTPILEKGEQMLDPGPVTLGILQDMGWVIGPTEKHAISGRVTDEDTGDPIADVTISTDKEQTTTTDADGKYQLGNLPADIYTVTAAKEGCAFSPESREVEVSSNVTGQDFTGTCLDGTPPQVSIEQPANGQTVTGLFTVEGQAADDKSGIDRVEVWLDNAKVGDANNDPNTNHYSLEIDSKLFTNGLHTLKVTAFDKAGNSNSASISLTFENDVSQPTITIAPPHSQLLIGQTVTTEVQIKNVANLYGLDFRLAFDPNLVQVVDADPDTPDTQIAVGSLFAGQDHFAARNQVENGRIEFSVSLRDPAIPIDGSGPVAAITWQALQKGTSELTFAEVKLSDRDSNPISHDKEAGAIEVEEEEVPTIITGTVLLQARTDHSGTDIFLTEATCPAAGPVVVIQPAVIPGMPYTITDDQGNFEITSFPGQTFRCLQAAHHGYLIGQHSFPEGELGTITLLGGDVTEDDIIDIFDLAYIAARYNSADPTADINADGLVDIFDLVIAGNNYNQKGPQSWPSSQP